MTKIAVVGVLAAFLVFYASTSPDSAANIVHAAWDGVVNLAHGIGEFIDKVSK